MKKRLIFIAKLFGTGGVLWLSWEFAVGGRSMGPGFSFFKNIHPLVYFLLVIIPPLLCLAFWGLRRGGVMISAAVVLILVAAHCACTIEERMFVEKHKEAGIGPTPRHFDRNSWLAYDAATGKLTGAD